MKKTTAILIALFLSLPALAAGRLRLAASAHILAPQDSGFKSIYGGSAIMPELSLSLQLLKQGLRLRFGAAVLAKSGTLDSPFADSAKTLQVFASLAPEWELQLSDRLALAIHAGGVLVSYSETAFAETVSGTAMGFDAGATAYLSLRRKLLGCLGIGYGRAGDSVNGKDITLGGFRAGIGLGVRL